MSDVLHNQVVRQKPRHFLKRIYKRFGAVLAPLFLLLFLGTAGWTTWKVIRTVPYFALKKIDWVGSYTQLNKSQLVQAVGIKPGINLFQISLKEVENNLLKFPWVDKVSVRRQIPSTLLIHVMEQKPAAILAAGDLYFVSGKGVIFKKMEQETIRDFPVVTGIPKEEPLGDAMHLLQFLNDFRDFDLFGISEIHYNEATGFSMVTLEGPVEVKLGRGNLKIKMDRLKKIWPVLQTRFGRVRGVDLDYEDKAFVKL